MTHIQPILIGDSTIAMKISKKLFESGVNVGDIRPPTVEEGTARLRITLSAEHSFEQLNTLINALSDIKKNHFL